MSSLVESGSSIPLIVVLTFKEASAKGKDMPQDGSTTFRVVCGSVLVHSEAVESYIKVLWVNIDMSHTKYSPSHVGPGSILYPAKIPNFKRGACFDIYDLVGAGRNHTPHPYGKALLSSKCLP